MNYKFTIVVPAYNEEDNLERLEDEILDFLECSIVSTKVLIINDFTTIKSQDLIQVICHKHSNFDYIFWTNNHGLSTAMKAGFDLVTTEWIDYMDADLQTSPKDFNLLLEHIKDYDLVTGVRQNRKDSVV